MPRMSTQYIVDSRGRKRAVVLPIKEFDRLMERLEELEDALALDEAIKGVPEFIEYQKVRDELKNEGRI